MSLPVPNLDDRSWKQIVDEAVRLIPRYCPEWTNHNQSDPGVTLLELYAWMTEMVIYRLNKVPEKNLLTFLDLIGVRLKPPEPARVVLELTPSEGAEGELLVKKGTQVATLQAGGADPVTFETLRDITLLPLRVVRAASSHRATVADHTEALASGEAREPLFAGVQEVERFLYLGDDRLNAFNEEAAVDLFFEAMPGSGEPRRKRRAPPELRRPSRDREAAGERRRDVLDSRQARRAPQGSRGRAAGQRLLAGRDPRRGHGAGERVRQHRQLHLPARRPGQELPSLRRGAQVRLRALPRPQGAVLGPRGAHPHRGAAGGTLRGPQPGRQPGSAGAMGILERPQVGGAQQDLSDGRLGRPGPVRLPRHQRRVHSRRRRQLRSARRHDRDGSRRSEELLGPRSHQRRKLRRARQIRAGRTELGVQGGPAPAAALFEEPRLQVRARAQARRALRELQRLPVPRPHRRPEHALRLLPALPPRSGRDARLLPWLRPEISPAHHQPVLRAG